MSGRTGNGPASTRQHVGPYEQWVYGLGRKYAISLIRDGGYRYLSALVEMPGGVDVTELAAALAPKPGEPREAWLPTLWQPRADYRYRFLPFALAAPCGFHEDPPRGDATHGPERAEPRLRLDRTAALLAPWASAGGPPIGFRVNLPITESRFDTGFSQAATRRGWKPAKGLDGKRLVIAAVIDDAFAFAHRGLRGKDGRSRIEFCWQQDGIAEPGGGVLFGKELTREAIDALAESHGDEDVLYDLSAAPGPDCEHGSLLSQLADHGSHVLGQFAGCDIHDMPLEDPDHIRIIAVQLPNHGALDTSGFGKEAHVLAAFHYIFERADLIAQAYGGGTPSLVVNFSYGFTGGPHDGLERLEEAIRDLVEERRKQAPTALVMPSGNSFISAMHGVIREELFEDDRFSVFWRVQPNDRSANYLELWFPEGTKIEDFSIGIRDPRGRPAYPLAALAPRPPGPDDVPEFVVSFPTEAPIGQISADYFRDKLWRVMVALAPTEPDGEKLPAAEAGLWFVDVARKKGAAVASGIECRIQRNSDVIGYTSGSRQSYFADWRDLPFDASGKPNQVDQPRAFIRRFGSLNGIATHDRVTLTAGLVTLSRDAACYSSAGYAPDRDAPRDAKVLCSAASDRADALQGIRGPGTRSGSYFALDGTSAAAPIVARQLVRAFQKNPAAGRRGAKDNYVSLLPGTPPRQERRTRLGMKMVPSS